MLVVSSGLFVRESHRTIAHGGELHVWFFDIGQGDAIFIETPTGEQILVDGGPDAGVLAKLGSVMAPWDKTIDAIVLTHPHADHVAGLVPVLERYDVVAIYDSGAMNRTGTMETFNEDAADERTVYHHVDETDRFAFGDVILDVVAPTSTREGTVPEDPNEASVVILLTFGETTLLLTGDATADIEGEIANAVGDIDVLKVGHHGSMTSSSYAFLETTTPEIGVISVGAENTYGHPHPAILKRLAERNIRVLRTDQDGDILLISDGGEPTVEPSPLPF